MSDIREFTTSEVAFVLREPIAAVKRAFDQGPVEPRLVAKPGGKVRAVGWSDVVYLHASRALRDELTSKARHELYLALKRRQAERARVVRVGRLSVEIGDFEDEVEARAKELAAKYGPQFEPGERLAQMAERGETFYGAHGARQKAA